MTTALTLYAIEDNYLALVNTEECVSPEQEEEFRAELAIALKSAVAKRDRVSQFLLACKHHEDAIDAEMKRLQALKKSWCAGRERMEKYVVGVIEGLGADAKGKFQTLKGETSTLSVRRNPVHVEITNAEAVSSEFKTVTVTISADDWRAILAMVCACDDFADMPLLKPIQVEIDKRAIKAAIEAGQDVPGADLGFGDLRLEVK